MQSTIRLSELNVIGRNGIELINTQLDQITIRLTGRSKSLNAITRSDNKAITNILSQPSISWRFPFEGRAVPSYIHYCEYEVSSVLSNPFQDNYPGFRLIILSHGPVIDTGMCSSFRRILYEEKSDLIQGEYVAFLYNGMANPLLPHRKFTNQKVCIAKLGEGKEIVRRLTRRASLMGKVKKAAQDEVQNMKNFLPLARYYAPPGAGLKRTPGAGLKRTPGAGLTRPEIDGDSDDNAKRARRMMDDKLDWYGGPGYREAQREYREYQEARRSSHERN